jgi:hypothetical protein
VIVAWVLAAAFILLAVVALLIGHEAQSAAFVAASQVWVAAIVVVVEVKK